MSLTEAAKAPTNNAAKKPATVFVDGGSGTTGLGINERLKLQSDVVVKTIADD
jgi:N-acetyl-gamma-glutamyl-phosphate reductase